MTGDSGRSRPKMLPWSYRTAANERGNTMGLSDKIKNTAQKVGGRGKTAAGSATGDQNLKAEGHTDQTKANLKQAGEKLKDAFKKH
jgi:uncharacterized protein YjbJ (UPF0337 family)